MGGTATKVETCSLLVLAGSRDVTDDLLGGLNQCGLELKELAIYKEIADSLELWNKRSCSRVLRFKIGRIYADLSFPFLNNIIVDFTSRKLVEV